MLQQQSCLCWNRTKGQDAISISSARNWTKNAPIWFFSLLLTASFNWHSWNSGADAFPMGLTTTLRSSDSSHPSLFKDRRKTLLVRSFQENPVKDTRHFSDIPQQDEKDVSLEDKLIEGWSSWFPNLPPSPEDEFILTGDMTVLFFYAWCSHSLPNLMVNAVMNQEGVSIFEAVNLLSNNDRSTQQQILSQPVWVNGHDHPQLMEHVWKIQAEESLLNHYGPLFSTVGVSSVVLCSCWLLAGWWHRTFCFHNTVQCEPSQALVKTVDTWFTTALMLMVLLWMTTQQQQQQQQQIALMTKADMMFIVDSCTVLILWRFLANFLLKMWFR